MSRYQVARSRRIEAGPAQTYAAIADYLGTTPVFERLINEPEPIP